MGYSLQKIEQRLVIQYRLKTDRKFFKQVNERKPLTESIQPINHASIKNENICATNQLKQNLFETIDALLKPEQAPENINPNLLVKKKKKHNLHL